MKMALPLLIFFLDFVWAFAFWFMRLLWFAGWLWRFPQAAGRLVWVVPLCVCGFLLQKFY